MKELPQRNEQKRNNEKDSLFATRNFKNAAPSKTLIVLKYPPT